MSKKPMPLVARDDDGKIVDIEATGHKADLDGFRRNYRSSGYTVESLPDTPETRVIVVVKGGVADVIRGKAMVIDLD